MRDTHAIEIAPGENDLLILASVLALDLAGARNAGSTNPASGLRPSRQILELRRVVAHRRAADEVSEAGKPARIGRPQRVGRLCEHQSSLRESHTACREPPPGDAVVQPFGAVSPWGADAVAIFDDSKARGPGTDSSAHNTV